MPYIVWALNIWHDCSLHSQRKRQPLKTRYGTSTMRHPIIPMSVSYKLGRSYPTTPGDYLPWIHPQWKSLWDSCHKKVLPSCTSLLEDRHKHIQQAHDICPVRGDVRDQLLSDSRELKHGAQNMERHHWSCLIIKGTGSLACLWTVALGFQSTGQRLCVTYRWCADQRAEGAT